MFLTRCSPASSKPKSSLSRTWSRTTRLTQIPPGSAKASSRAATLTPSPWISGVFSRMKIKPTNIDDLTRQIEETERLLAVYRDADEVIVGTKDQIYSRRGLINQITLTAD